MGTPPPDPSCEDCDDIGFVHPPESTTSYVHCECYFRNCARAIVEKAPAPIRKALEGMRLLPDHDYHYRVFPPMKFRAWPIAPSVQVAKYGFSLADQAGLITKLKENPLLGYAYFGSTGVGKSFLMWAQAQECAYAGVSVIFRSVSQYLEGMRLGPSADDYHPDGIYIPAEGVTNRTMVFLDELDNFAVNDFSKRKLFELADSCWRHMGWIRVSFASNITSEELKSKVGDAAMRRFNELTSKQFNLVSEG